MPLGDVRIPSVPGLGGDMGKTGARRRTGDADEVLAGGALNLSAGVLSFAFQWLVTM